MKINWLIASTLYLTASLALADGHTDAALDHIKATDLQTTFAITTDGVLYNLNAYKTRLLSSPIVRGNPKSIKMTEEFIAKARQIAEDVYSWKSVESMYVSALKETYTEDELLQINAWLATKYGKLFIAKQKDFMLKTINIGNTVGQQFQQRTAALEREYSENVSKLPLR